MIESERLILRPLTLDDAPVLQELLDDPTIAEKIPSIPHPLPAGGAEEWIREAVNDVTFALIGREGPERGEIVGVIGIHLEHGNRGAIGGWVAQEWRHKRYAVEALHACVRYAYEDLGLTTVYMLRKGRVWVAPPDFADHHIPFKRDPTAWEAMNDLSEDGPVGSALARASRRLGQLIRRG